VALGIRRYPRLNNDALLRVVLSVVVILSPVCSENGAADRNNESRFSPAHKISPASGFHYATVLYFQTMKSNTVIVSLTLLISVFIIWTGITGMIVPEFYVKETDNWRRQAIGQDYINVFLLVPFLLNTVLMIRKKSQDAKLLWAGAMVYAVYTYTIYCFDVHFNSLFPAYCTILGLGVFSLVYFIYSHRNTFFYKSTGRKTSLTTGIYLIVLSACFGLLWSIDIFPAVLHGSVPASTAGTGLPTNPVHVMDLSVFLPGLFITGWLLIRRKKPGLVLAPVALTFILLMTVTIGILALLADGNPAVATIMFFLAAFTFVLLILEMRSKNLAV
jgi:hypothetical protein